MKGANRSEELQEAIEAIDMEMWLTDQGVDYRRTHGSRGAQLNIKECPCCGSSSWKVFMNAASGLGNCFAGDCGVKFNKWKFISSCRPGVQMSAIVQEIKDYAKSLGWRPKVTAPLAEVRNDSVRMPDSELISRSFSGPSYSYLRNRGILESTMRDFHLRDCERGWFDYTDSDGQSKKQRYHGRVIIPVFDLDGVLSTFQGRDITGTAEKKYLFPPGLAGSARYLYNGHNAKKATSVVLGEGAFDVWAIKQAIDGLDEFKSTAALGTFGKHLSIAEGDSQLTDLRVLQAGGLREVVFMWDSEAQALKDAVEAALMLRKF